MSFFEKYKKIIAISVFLGFSALMGYALYAIFFRSAPEIAPGDNNITATDTAGSLPSAGQSAGQAQTADQGVLDSGAQILPQGKASEVATGGLTQTQKLNSGSALGPEIGADGSQVRYYNREDGKFYRIGKDGSAETMSDKIFYDVEKVTWAGTADKAVLEYPDGSNIVYNFETKKQVTLPSHWKDFDFSPDSSQLAMKSIGIDPENRWLVVSNDDGSQVRALEALGEKDETVFPSWSPNRQIAAMFIESRGFDRQEVYFVGLNQENFKSTIVEGRGFQHLWSPEGDKLLYSVYSSSNDMKPSLWVVGAEGDEIGSGRKNLKIDTWADKCSYSSETEIYCAVPENLPQGAGLFTELSDSTKDRLYKINTATGAKKLVAVPDDAFNMSDLQVSDDGSNLFFKDKTSGELYRIRLK